MVSSPVYPWQYSQWGALSQQFLQQRIPHALLCRGAKGLGKSQFARQLAMKLLCDHPDEAACEKCDSCHLFLSDNHPDFYLLSPLEKQKTIKIDQIREVIAKLAQTSHRKAYQVVLIEPAESLTTASSNALLKTLEEPLGQVIFILVAHQLNTIPATIISRCQSVYFHCPAPELVLPWLMQQTGVNREQATTLLQLSSGAPLLAVDRADSAYQMLRQQLLKGLWQLCQGSETPQAVAEPLLKQDVMTSLDLLFTLIMDVFRLSLNMPDCSIQNQDYKKQLHKLRDKVSLEGLAHYLPSCLRMRQRLHAMSGLNVQLALEELLIRWQQLRIVSC